MLFFRAATAKLGIDKAIAYTIFSRLIQGFGGVGSVIFIARNLTKNEQGYYYTFGSIIAIQIFFELGLSAIITQYVAHEMAHIRWSDEVNTIGKTEHRSRVASLLHFCVKWFSVISLLFFLILLGAGYFFFSKYNSTSAIEWQGPWIILAVATSGFLFIDPLLAFLEGMGKVKDVASMRVIQQTVYFISVVLFLMLGFKLYSSAVATLLSFLSLASMLFFSNKLTILRNLWKIKGEWRVNYREEIFPYQWKIALSWVSGYFIFQLFNPVLFATEGPVIAGQMGITLAALNGLLGLSMSWINTKIPLFSGLIAKQEYKQLDIVFYKSLGQSLFITAAGMCFIYTVITLLQATHIPIGKRFLSSYPLMFMCVCYFINNMIFGLATYLRCHKKEPLLSQAVVFAILTSLSTFVLGKVYGLIGITMGYLILTIVVGAPWVIIVFFRKKKEWHHKLIY